jgi:hypothetical protein
MFRGLIASFLAACQKKPLRNKTDKDDDPSLASLLPQMSRPFNLNSASSSSASSASTSGEEASSSASVEGSKENAVFLSLSSLSLSFSLSLSLFLSLISPFLTFYNLINV